MEPDSAGDVATLDALCHSVAEVFRLTPHPPTRLSVTLGGAALEIEWPAASAPVPVPVHEEVVANGPTVDAPLVGTFYHAAGPGEAPFVRPGDVVQEGQQVGIVEAMKVLNAVLAPCRARVAGVLVGDGEPVEYGQALIALDPGLED